MIYVACYSCVLARAEFLQSCLTLCNPTEYNLPGFCVCGILQARILDCIVMPSGIEPVSLMSLALAGGFFNISTTSEAPSSSL